MSTPKASTAITPITPADRFRRRLEAFSDRIRLQPVGLFVFLASVGGLMFLQFGSLNRIKAPAVATARPFEHPSDVASVVAEVHVKVGEFVDAGAPLVTLSSRDLNRELAEIDAELDRMEKRSVLELARLGEDHRQELAGFADRLEAAKRDLELARAVAVEPNQKAELADAQEAEVKAGVAARTRRADDLFAAAWQRGLAKAERAGAKQRIEAESKHVQALESLGGALPTSPTLERASAALYAAELQLLRVRRSEVLEDLQTLTVVARQPGRVAMVLQRGAAVLKGASVASLVPERADEIVAYVSADTSPRQIETDEPATITDPFGACDEPGHVIRVGATVEEAPGQIRSFLQFPIHGLPVYITVPESCDLGVGQLLSVEFDKALR